MTVVRYTAGLCQKNFFNLVADSEVNEITFSLYHFYLLCSMAQRLKECTIFLGIEQGIACKKPKLSNS